MDVTDPVRAVADVLRASRKAYERDPWQRANPKCDPCVLDATALIAALSVDSVMRASVLDIESVEERDTRFVLNGYGYHDLVESYGLAATVSLLIDQLQALENHSRVQR